jgi:hypothetical protein
MLMLTPLLHTLMNKNIDSKPKPQLPDMVREVPLEMLLDLPHEHQIGYLSIYVCGKNTVMGINDNKSTNFVKNPMKY